MTAAAESGIFLNVRIISYCEDNADDADDEQYRDKDDLVPGSQSAVELFKEVLEEFDHTGYASIKIEREHSILRKKALSYLDRVQGGAFSDIVDHDPEVQTIFDGIISTHPSHIGFVLPGHVKVERIDAPGGIVIYQHAWHLSENGTGFVRSQFFFGLYIDRFRMA